MKSSKKIDVSKASLISLKAELSRKQDEVNIAKARGTFIHPTPHPKKQTIWTKKNVGVNERDEKDVEQERADEDVFTKSRAALEAKSKLYDKLSHGRPTGTTEDDTTFLVNFQQKSSEEKESELPVSDEYDSPSDPEEDWVDYTDCLGRTRKCLRKDLDYLKQKDADLFKSLGGFKEKPKKEAEHEVQTEGEPEMLSTDMRRELLRQKWEQQEEQLRNKADIHYQDVLFDEARSHGVGYYGFSQDEEARRKQQESLTKLRKETQRQQEATKDVRERRRLQLEARLKAAQRRKRERMGLPPEEEEPEPQPEASVQDEEEDKAEEEVKPEVTPSTSKPPKIRAWDIGKEGVKEVMSQEDWIKKKRVERPQAFAPPSSYQPDFLPGPEQYTVPKPKTYFTSRKPSTVVSEEEPDRPEQQQKNLYVASKRPKTVGSEEDPDKSEQEKKTMYVASNRPMTVGNVEEPDKPEQQPKIQYVASKRPMKVVSEEIPDRPQPKIQKQNIHLQYRSMMSRECETRTPIRFEYEDPSTSLASTECSDEAGDSGRGKGTEIAPPPTFDYYGPTFATTKRNPSKAKDLESSITAGLKYLRRQAEEREKQPEKGLLDII